jgi:hypothetical protein
MKSYNEWQINEGRKAVPTRNLIDSLSAVETEFGPGGIICQGDRLFFDREGGVAPDPMVKQMLKEKGWDYIPQEYGGGYFMYEF